MDRRDILIRIGWLLALGAWSGPAMADDNDDDDDDDDDDHDDDEDDDHDYDDDEEGALRAFQAEEAISLREMIKIFRSEIDGEIIDIALFKRRVQLHYRFLYINENGRVASVVYLAATGQRVEN
ncbi:hypothetical protein MNBD_ALPHA11-904 [hydrothermal vent metagenome]|uniref:PepSY domain-containing protein n=1 Tax=hydrothermal vent metagenome TaxID=652676 RepID=A0A3B0UZ14_9ZZZZ